MPFLGVLVGATGVGFGVLALHNKQSKGMAVTGIVLAAMAMFLSFAVTAAVFSPEEPADDGAEEPTTELLEEPEKEPKEEPKPKAEPEPEPKPDPEPKYDGTQFAKEIETKWKQSWGIGAEESWALLNEDPEFQTLLGHISHLESPAENIINIILTIDSDQVDTDEASDLAKNQLPMMIGDDRVETLQFISADGAKVGDNKGATERTATDQGLTGTYAQGACEMHASQVFVYGYTLHWIVGKLAEKVRPDEIFLKVQATVKNEYGTKVKGINVECYVSGTNDSPVVTDFLFY